MSFVDVVKQYKMGLLIGFLFGTVGLFILAGLSLVSQFFELISSPLMFFGRLLAPENGTDYAVVMLTLANGIFYALVGMLVQFIVRKSKS